MLFTYYLSKPINWILPLILQVIVYYRLLRKMCMDPRWAFIPFVAEGKMSKNLFRHKSLHLHFLVLTAIMLGGGFYLRYTRGGFQAKLFGIVFTLIAILIYGLFMMMLYWRICNCFGKGFFYKVGTLIFPIPFLFLLTRAKEIFWGFPEFQPIIRSKPMRFLFGLLYEGAFILVALSVFGAVAYFSAMLYPPRPLVQLMLADKNESIRGLKGDGRIVERIETMGSDYFYLNSRYSGRDRYFPDHTNDESVVVLEYIIGSNLEDTRGLATYNIDQMKDATKEGEGLKFVIQAGGSYRWFTEGIKDETVARYEIANGKLEKVADASESRSMVNSEELYDFLSWAKKEYPADRYMLVFWDHGGGLSSGFGDDPLRNEVDPDHETMLVSDIVDALKKADMKFDMIGFDACLMQDIEIAYAMEPYADFYLGSEETESGDGWYYTSAFGLLARNPNMKTEDFAKELISAFDLYNAIANHGEAQTDTTLSLIDLSRIKAAYDALEDLYEKQDAAIRKDPADYGDISLAVSNSYPFSGSEQVDLIDYLQRLDETDYDDTIVSSQYIKDLIARMRAAVVYRNAVSNYGINGLAVTFPYDSLTTYDKEHSEFVALDLEKTAKFYDDYFSVMAYMKTNSGEPVEVFGIPIEAEDYTQREWYVSGFENYAEIPSIIDIPMIATEDGYLLDLPDSAWKIVVDSDLVMFQKAEKGWRYLGRDVPGALDEYEHPMASTDGTWIHINNRLVSYETQTPVEAPEGIIYKGTVKARLNNKDDILLQVEWEPVSEDTSSDIKGKVKGYTFLDNDLSHREKGIQELSPGDSLRFLFDIYDEDGNLVETEAYGSTLRVSKQESLEVADKPLGECDVRYGIRLTDIFQREFVTEMIDEHIPQ